MYHGPMDFFALVLNSTSLDSADDYNYSEVDNEAVMRSLLAEKEKLEQMARIAYQFAVMFVVLGVLAVLLNIFVLLVILWQRERTLRQVFYVIVLGFILIDTMRGLSLILWSTRLAMKTNLSKVHQIVLLVFRFCNLATVMNIFIITANEYLFFRFPFRYNRYVTQGRVILMMILSYAGSLIVVITSAAARNSGSSHAIMISHNTGKWLEHNRTDETSMETESHQYIYDKDFEALIKNDNSQDGKRNGNYSSLLLLAFCASCLLGVIAMYYLSYLVVRRLQMIDARNRSGARGSIISTESTCSTTLSLQCSLPVTNPGRRMSGVSIISGLVKRYKYFLVVGALIVFYSLFLVSYGCIHLIHYFRFLADSIADENREYLYIRFALQLVIAVHAILQPLCYFRIREFRSLTLETLCKQRYLMNKKKRMSLTFNTLVSPQTMENLCLTPLSYVN